MATANRQILGPADTVSETFASAGTRMTLLIDTHAGGVWQLERNTPLGNWVAVSGLELSANGEWNFWTGQGAEYRLAGGTVGAHAWITGAVS